MAWDPPWPGGWSGGRLLARAVDGKRTNLRIMLRPGRAEGAEVRGLSGSMIFRGPAAILALLLAVATGAPGCAFNHVPDMKAGIDKLPIPSSYGVLRELVDYKDEFFDLRDITVTRWYRSPLDLEGTCEQLRAAF